MKKGLRGLWLISVAVQGTKSTGAEVVCFWPRNRRADMGKGTLADFLIKAEAKGSKPVHARGPSGSMLFTC